MHKKIHIVSFDVPYPPNYGGVIDVFYKIKALHSIGVNIILHLFEYGRGEQEELKKYCEQVFYYKREVHKRALVSRLPFITKTRCNEQLEKRLLQDDFPILFEGLHTTELIYNNKLNDRFLLVRTHNIEHEYYRGLVKTEANFWKKSFFKLESLKLKKYQSVLKKTTYILSISPVEQDYFYRLYGSKTVYIPVFTNMEFTEFLPEENFILWHGDLRVSDNVKSALQAIEVVKNTAYRLVIAASYKCDLIIKACELYENVTIDFLENENDLEVLLTKAKVNLLFTYQPTGIKLKLINTLVKSRIVLTNEMMVDGTGLEELCVIANSTEEIKHQLKELMNTLFTDEDRSKRKELLKSFDVKLNAQKIIDLLD
ncbi:glycosyltransferase [Wenyingzhuangia marina]|uniref:Uncharacterized protein n=1 Tax=Wenyingzhuangia marina TaxID=1195760 RepID=A0A1M5SIW4_9FLAO|nr:glycosyltransferase [Wenyingzhuangia marina]GGF62441.1 hypothetical protein GCM10011397_01980 [Wenyingzhuangia marina]SHH38476.1 hypothetical protein SAMN05444281_0338 [Wenyingzhuangia marina]